MCVDWPGAHVQAWLEQHTSRRRRQLRLLRHLGADNQSRRQHADSRQPRDLCRRRDEGHVGVTHQAVLTTRAQKCTLSKCTEEPAMPRSPVKDNSRVALRIRPTDKAVLLRAVALAQTNLTDFILHTTLREAQ